MYKLTVVLSWLVYCECAYLYSSFWAPLYDPRILNYRVDSTFGAHEGVDARALYERRFGKRGEILIADLGNGKGPGEATDYKVNRDVKFYYTYPGAENNLQ